MAERQIALLERLAEAGARMVEALADRAEAAAGVPEIERLDLAFSRVTRAVRLTHALQSKISDGLLALVRGEAVAAPKPAAAEPTAREQRAERAQRIVERVIADEGYEDRDVERLSGRAWERLEDEDVYGDILNRPMGEIVQRICEDLDLDPDWATLVREAWAVQEIEGGVWVPPLPERAAAVASPLHHATRGPPPPMGEEWRWPGSG